MTFSQPANSYVESAIVIKNILHDIFISINMNRKTGANKQHIGRNNVTICLYRCWESSTRNGALKYRWRSPSLIVNAFIKIPSIINKSLQHGRFIYKCQPHPIDNVLFFRDEMILICFGVHYVYSMCV